LNSEQSNAYQIAIDSFVANNKQLIMFISGESGTGKTMLANMIAQGAQCLFNTSNQNEFNRKSSGSVICTASTGAGAFKIEGHLWQRVLEKSFRYFQKKLSDVRDFKLVLNM
jgi:type IV secretory pathway VirB4 component